MHAKPLQLLRRLARKDSAPREDLRRIGVDIGKDVGGDEPVDALLSAGYAVERRGVLWITEAGRRAVAAHA